MRSIRSACNSAKELFRDKRFSADDTIACSSCHDVANGGDDGRRVAIGIGERSGRLNSPTVLNSSLNLAQFWDGRAATLEEQLHWPIESPVEMGSSLGAGPRESVGGPGAARPLRGRLSGRAQRSERRRRDRDLRARARDAELARSTAISAATSRR